VAELLGLGREEEVRKGMKWYLSRTQPDITAQTEKKKKIGNPKTLDGLLGRKGTEGKGVVLIP